MAITRPNTDSRLGHANTGFVEARTYGSDGPFYSSVDVKGNWSEGYSSKARIAGPIPENPSLVQQTVPMGISDRTPPMPTWVQEQRASRSLNKINTDSHTVYANPDDVSVFGKRKWKTANRAGIAGEAMLNRIHEGRNVHTGRSN